MTGAGEGPTVSRRRFLARAGVLGAGVLILGRPSGTGARGLSAAELDGVGEQALQALTRDTFRGMVVMWVPGRDPYSRAQGEVSPTPGAVEAKVDQFFLDDLDLYFPFPQEILSPAVQALATSARDDDARVPVPSLPVELAAALDEALGLALSHEQGQGTPVTLLVALLLNYLATTVRPAAVAGPFPASPFANLSFAQKIEAWRRLENDYPDLLAIMDGGLDEPATESLSGLLKLLGSDLPTFTAFAAYSEYEAFDRALGRAVRRPIGWRLAHFAPGRSTPADGWDELKGYYRGLR